MKKLFTIITNWFRKQPVQEPKKRTTAKQLREQRAKIRRKIDLI